MNEIKSDITKDDQHDIDTSPYDKSNPKVSIGLPVYNGDKYLRKTLDCLLGQTFPDFELIISDDGSTDQTEEICREYAALDSRIHYFRQPKNFGMPVKNFHFVLNKAIGEYFMFASHDDLWSENFIEVLTGILNADKDCALAFSGFKIKNLQGEGEILLTPSSSTSKSPYVRYLSRIIDMQPHLIFGLFRRSLVSSQDFQMFDFFEVNFGLLTSLRGNIRIVNEHLFSWGIDGTRNSYSMTAKCMNYLPFYLAQIRLIWTKFSVFKALAPFFILTYLMVAKTVKLRIDPASSNLNFEQ